MNPSEMPKAGGCNAPNGNLSMIESPREPGGAIPSPRTAGSFAPRSPSTSRRAVFDNSELVARFHALVARFPSLASHLPALAQETSAFVRDHDFDIAAH